MKGMNIFFGNKRKKSHGNSFDLIANLRHLNRVLKRQLNQLEIKEQKSLQLIQKSPRHTHNSLKKTLLDLKLHKEKLQIYKLRVEKLLIQIVLNKSSIDIQTKIELLNRELINELGLKLNEEEEDWLEFSELKNVFLALFFKKSIEFCLKEILNFIYIQY